MPPVVKVISDILAELDRNGKATSVEEFVSEFEGLLRKHGLEYRRLGQRYGLGFAIYDREHDKDIVIRLGAWK
jgi:hypothetical protein